MLALAGPAWAAPGATDQDAVRAALARPGVAAALEARVRAVAGEAQADTAWPTPRFSLSHEQVVGPVAVTMAETSAMVQQRVDLSGWRAQRRRAVPAQAAALRAEVQGWRLDAAAAVRRAFYQVHYRQARRAALQAWQAQLDRAHALVQAREVGGDAAAWHTQRVARALAIARARIAAEAAALSEARAALSGWTGWRLDRRLDGALRPADAPDGPARRPELARLAHAAEALSARAQALAAPATTGWSVGLGYRMARVGDAVGHGVLASLSLPLSLWDPNAGRRAQLRAEGAALTHELGWRTARAEQATQAARARLAQTRAALDALPSPDQGALVRLAEAAFAAGEAPLTALLDAHRSQVDLDLGRIDLEWATRRAALALDRHLGKGVPQ